MLEEEKEVIRMIKTGLEVKVEGTQIETIILKRKSAEILLNLIQKQEKEIEEYERLFKRQKELEEEKIDLIKQGWLNE